MYVKNFFVGLSWITCLLLTITAQSSESPLSLSYTIEDGTIPLTKLAPTDAQGNTIAQGKVLVFDTTTTSWIPQAPTPAGLASGAVSSTHVAENAVTATKLAASAVSSTHLETASVTTTALSDGSVTAAKLATGALPYYFMNMMWYITVGNVTQYSAVGSSSNQQTATAARIKRLVPRAGVFKNLRVLFNEGTITDGATATYTLMVNDVAQALSVQLTSNDDSAGTIKSNTTTEVSVSASDIVYLREVIDGAVDFSTADVYVTVHLELH